MVDSTADCCQTGSQGHDERYLDSCPFSMRGPAKLQRAKLLPASAFGSVLRQAGLLARTCTMLGQHATAQQQQERLAAASIGNRTGLDVFGPH